jgi:hypothetical protein
MSKSCGHNSACGCQDKSLNTPAPCNESGACSGENCAEIFNAECIYIPTEMSFSVGGEIFSAGKGMRVDTFLQKLLVFTNDPACADLAPIGFRVNTIGITTASVSWAGDNSKNYQVEWSDGTPVTGDVIGATSLDIINLVADTEYTIKVTNTDDDCVSVTLTFKTKK